MLIWRQCGCQESLVESIQLVGQTLTRVFVSSPTGRPTCTQHFSHWLKLGQDPFASVNSFSLILFIISLQLWEHLVVKRHIFIRHEVLWDFFRTVELFLEIVEDFLNLSLLSFLHDLASLFFVRTFCFDFIVIMRRHLIAQFPRLLHE